jgi:hypothetical protein
VTDREASSQNFWSKAKRLLLTATLALAVTACATRFQDGNYEKIFTFPNHTVALSHNLCLVSAELKSSGPAIPTLTLHTLMIAAHTTTSLTALVACPPVVAGGKAVCNVLPIGNQAPILTAGVGCGGWDSFNLN